MTMIFKRHSKPFTKKGVTHKESPHPKEYMTSAAISDLSIIYLSLSPVPGSLMQLLSILSVLNGLTLGFIKPSLGLGTAGRKGLPWSLSVVNPSLKN
jgi:hypothetical protein